MPRLTLKAVQEQLAAVKQAAQKYYMAVHAPKTILSSTTDGVQKTPEGAKGNAMVTINDLIATTRTAEQTGYLTTLRVVNGGKSLEVVFVEDVRRITLPKEFYN